MADICGSFQNTSSAAALAIMGPKGEFAHLDLTFFCALGKRVQGQAKRSAVPCSANFVAAIAYHSYLSLPAAFTQPGYHLLAEPCPQRCVDAHNARMLARTPDGRRKSQNEFLFGRRGALLNRIFFHRGFT